MIVAVVWGRKQISDYFNILSWVWTFMGTLSVHLAPVNPGWHLEGKNVIRYRTLKTLNFQTGSVPPMQYGGSYKWPGSWTTQKKGEDKTFRKPCPVKTGGYGFLLSASVFITRVRLKRSGKFWAAKSFSLGHFWSCHWSIDSLCSNTGFGKSL